MRTRPLRRDPQPFAYQDEHGREVFQHVRWRLDPPVPRPKTFTYRWRRGPGCAWVPQKPDCADRYVYRLPQLLTSLSSTDCIWWPEGEGCATALCSVGAVATSHHQGAGKVTVAQARWFKGYRGTVILVADRDLPGAADAVRRYDLLRHVGIPSSRLRLVVAADEVHETPGTDAADHLAAGLSLDDFRAVPIKTARRYAARAQPAHYTSAGYWS